MKARRLPTRRRAGSPEHADRIYRIRTSTRAHRAHQSGISSLELIDRAVNMGIRVDAQICVPRCGSGLLTVEASVCMASSERYLQFAQEIEDATTSLPSAQGPDEVTADASWLPEWLEAQPS